MMADLTLDETLVGGKFFDVTFGGTRSQKLLMYSDTIYILCQSLKHLNLEE